MNRGDPFDAKAATWDDDPMRRQRAQAVARAIVKTVPLHDGTRVLDFGCGTGLLGRALLPTVGEVVFADPSEGMRRELRSRLEKSGRRDSTRVVHPDELPRLGSYDLVASLMTLHHLPDVPGSITGLARLLSDEGWMALADLDREDGSFHRGEEGPVHHGFDREELRRFLVAAGMVSVESRTVFTIEKLVEGRRREYPVFLLLARKD